MTQLLAAMRRSLALISGTTLARPDRGTGSIDGHAAVAPRDEDGAEAAACRHIGNAHRARLRIEA